MRREGARRLVNPTRCQALDKANHHKSLENNQHLVSCDVLRPPPRSDHVHLRTDGLVDLALPAPVWSEAHLISPKSGWASSKSPTVGRRAATRGHDWGRVDWFNLLRVWAAFFNALQEGLGDFRLLKLLAPRPARQRRFGSRQTLRQGGSLARSS